ncbi:magnesium chelatase subunit D [Prosthecomicrobium sp. N25]|uniref:magnesium chelatase subunit D n=1 Tax=Prosthecomicrobium sp. N25 TaxID=3129254 RepID=UPI003078240D
MTVPAKAAAAEPRRLPDAGGHGSGGGPGAAADAGDAGALAWADAVTAALLFAIDPVGTGGILVRAHAGPVRDRYIALLQGLMPQGAAWRRLPAGIGDGRLIGGLDLTATLAAGRPVAERGLLAEADGGVLVVPMAERLPAGTAARLVAALDSGRVVLERDGLKGVHPAHFGVVALDESLPDEDGPAPTLAERLAFRVDLTAVRIADLGAATEADDLSGLRRAVRDVRLSAPMAEALAVAAVAFGAGSLRADLLAAAAARASAALGGAAEIAEDDVMTAVRLVILPRATRLPAAEAEAEAAPAEPPPAEPEATETDAAAPDPADKPLAERIVEATRAVLPAHLLAALQTAPVRLAGPRHEGRAGPAGKAALRGRPLGARPGDPRSGARLDLVETLRAAAPWQKLRAGVAPSPAAPGPLVRIARGDCRIVRFRHRTRTTTVFVVDASGSSALNRLAEAKGAVEILLGDCYVRRDRVAVVAFRGRSADLILPPTHSLTRARASMAGLPGGGGTPLASAIEAGTALAGAVRRRGEAAQLVFLTDGAANVARDGAGGRPRAEADALAAARALRAEALPALVIDTAPRPAPRARAIAEAMGARYLALPQADAATIGAVLKAATPAAA